MENAVYSQPSIAAAPDKKTLPAGEAFCRGMAHTPRAISKPLTIGFGISGRRFPQIKTSAKLFCHDNRWE
jgi:hypothetical protein